MAKLTSRFWVDAYLMRLQMFDIPAFIVAHGDDTGGAVLLKLSTLDGQAVLFQRSFDLMTGERNWLELASGADRDVDVSIDRQKSFDPDVWVIEVEDRSGRHLLDQEGLS